MFHKNEETLPLTKPQSYTKSVLSDVVDFP